MPIHYWVSKIHSHITNAATRPANPSKPTPPLKLAVPSRLVSIVVASPGANMTGTLKSADSLISSGVSMALSSASQDGLSSLAGILLVTEMGRSKMV